MEIKIYTDI